jgi:hypothetical protein
MGFPTIPIPRQRTLRHEADECRAHASACAEMASRASDPQAKRDLEWTAEQWHMLANGAEKYTLKTKRTP